MWSIEENNDEIIFNAGILKRTITITQLDDGYSLSSDTFINDVLVEKSNIPILFRFFLASPNERPKGITLDEITEVIDNTATEDGGTDTLNVNMTDSFELQTVKWINPTSEKDISFRKIEKEIQSKLVKFTFSEPESDVDYIDDIKIALYYEIYENYPAIRKWIKIINTGENWIKVDNLVVEPLTILKEFQKKTDYTPSERGACSSIIGFSNKTKSNGLILCSEIPSVLRRIDDDGTMGYTSKYFEWVIGPNEMFDSEPEPVSILAFEGEVIKTISSISYPMDRFMESQFQRYIEEILKIRAARDHLDQYFPLWCSWSNIGAAVNEENIKISADLAAQCGFKCFQIDAGWSKSQDLESWSAGSVEPHPIKFPNFKDTCDYIISKGLNLGLWVSVFREEGSKDLIDLPNARSLPLVKRKHGYGMAFASDWKNYYANDIISLHHDYNALYFKQDLTNIKYGDIAEGHDSRTRKESFLRAIRGYFDSQDKIHEETYHIRTLMSHEIYWGTPGVPCDVAVLKHCSSYHIPPNDYSGVYPRSTEYIPENQDKFDSKSKILQKLLKLGCLHSRNRNYLHRGLPLYCIEYYGAGTLNAAGSLTKEIQDRQICSWLMGGPSVYAGDLRSLTEENISHYNKRFSQLKELHKKYNIYQYFQHSGVPSEPDKLDRKWNWWGKLNGEGYGCIIVVRGWFGIQKKNASKKINIPWVHDKQYNVKALFADKELGTFTSQELNDGKISLTLPKLGCEILELSKL